MGKKQAVGFNLNGKPIEISVEGRRTLLEVLREDFALTGTKEGCAEGECGACTVLLDGTAVLACLTLVGDAQGRSVTTVEGLRRGDVLHPVQEAFIEQGAIQCGYCTPGMLLSAKALLDRNDNPSRSEIQTAIGGNLCRCTGYQKIIAAVEVAAQRKATGRGWE